MNTEKPEQKPSLNQPPPLIPLRDFLANGGVVKMLHREQQQQQQQAKMQEKNIVSSSQNVQNNDDRNRETTTNQQAHQDFSIQPGTSTSTGKTSKVILMPEPEPTRGRRPPYKMQKKLIGRKFLPCINMKPYNFTEKLVTLHDLTRILFCNVPVESCRIIMKLLGINLHKPNVAQSKVLMKARKIKNLDEEVLLVPVQNVIDSMTQLKFMMGGLV